MYSGCVRLENGDFRLRASDMNVMGLFPVLLTEGQRAEPREFQVAAGDT